MKILFRFSFLLVLCLLTNCISLKSREEFSQSRYGNTGGLVDAPSNQHKSRLQQVRDTFNARKF